MDTFTVATEDDLAHARKDPAFRQQLLSQNLDRLLAVLNALQRGRVSKNPALVGQIREGAQLAVRLAEIIRRLDSENGHPAAAAQSSNPPERVAVKS